MKISSDSMIATEKKPVKPSHGACTLALPCDSNSPSDGEPGGRPKPRKSSAVSVITDDDTMNGRNVMVATMAFGNRWRNMITRIGDAERARRLDVFEIAPAQKFRAHQADQRHPGEQQQNAEQHEEAGHQHRGQDQQQIERGNRSSRSR